MSIAYLALGSNLDEPKTQVCQAMRLLGRHPLLGLVSTSSLYQSPPLSDMTQPDYINAVIAVETQLEPISLLKVCQQIESEMGRVRTSHWAARIIDVDIVSYDNIVMDTENLTLPHPHYDKRSFVILPLLEISPALVMPDGQNIQTLAKQISSQKIQKVANECS